MALNVDVVFKAMGAVEVNKALMQTGASAKSAAIEFGAMGEAARGSAEMVEALSQKSTALAELAGKIKTSAGSMPELGAGKAGRFERVETQFEGSKSLAELGTSGGEFSKQTAEAYENGKKPGATPDATEKGMAAIGKGSGQAEKNVGKLSNALMSIVASQPGLAYVGGELLAYGSYAASAIGHIGSLVSQVKLRQAASVENAAAQGTEAERINGVGTAAAAGADAATYGLDKLLHGKKDLASAANIKAGEGDDAQALELNRKQGTKGVSTDAGDPNEDDRDEPPSPPNFTERKKRLAELKSGKGMEMLTPSPPVAMPVILQAARASSSMAAMTAPEPEKTAPAKSTNCEGMNFQGAFAALLAGGSSTSRFGNNKKSFKRDTYVKTGEPSYSLDSAGSIIVRFAPIVIPAHGLQGELDHSHV